MVKLLLTDLVQGFPFGACGGQVRHAGVNTQGRPQILHESLRGRDRVDQEAVLRPDGMVSHVERLLQAGAGLSERTAQVRAPTALSRKEGVIG